MLQNTDNETLIQETVTSEKGWFVSLPISPSTNYTLTTIDTSINYAYLHGSNNDLENGISILNASTGNTITKENYNELYDSPYGNKFHFSTPKNWMNDPNGICFWKGYYHMFYQSNPHSLKWGDMHWGHAVSKDLVHWTHMPIVLFPQNSLKDCFDRKGGAYSGSAFIENDKMYLYFTRCLSPILRDATTTEYQAVAHFNGEYVIEEKPIINSFPLATSNDFNFRDPKVVIIDGIPTLIIATTIDGICSVVAYRRKDNSEWTFECIMLQDKEIDCNSFECANFFEDKKSGLCALICSIQDKISVGWQRRTSRVYICRREGLELLPIVSRRVDFGNGSYALQLMSGVQNENIAFAWCPDTFGLLKDSAAKTNGCLTIPLSLSIEKMDLVIKPHSSILSLISSTHKATIDLNGFFSSLLDSFPYHLSVDFLSDTSFEILLAQSQDKRQSLALRFEKGIISFAYSEGNKRTEEVFQGTQISGITRLEIFTDESVTEVFVNNGHNYGCTSFFISDRKPMIEGSFETPSNVNKIEISMLRSIWKYEKEKQL